MIIKNKGTGAGGARTNLNGLPYEKMTDLASEFSIVSRESTHKVVHFNADPQNDRNFIRARKNKFKKYMEPFTNHDMKWVHGSKKPDECYIDENSKTIFVIEKKFQQIEGSICEKIQSAPCKIWNYKKIFPQHNIVYTYTLSDWYKEHCPAELEYLEEKNIPVFWGNDDDYKSQMVNYITNYGSKPQS